MMNEDEYISKIQTGVSSAYQFLVEQYQTGLVIYCERLVKDRYVAEDLAQEAFIKAYQNLAMFDSKKARFSTWLYRIASNKAIDYLRKAKHTIDVEDIEALADTAAEPTLLDDEIFSHPRSSRYA